jgi:microcin C transport system ATP-binding protein
MSTPALLSIENLSISFPTAGGGTSMPVQSASLEIRAGEMLALVGESGSGKSLTAHAIMRLLPTHALLSGSIRFHGEELLTAPEVRLRQLRGHKVGMIFQEPMTSLNPLHTVLKQISEVLYVHQGLRPNAARARTLELLELVGIRDAAKRLDAYPHELSGGQRQRVMIAMALANNPELLIADEPTTALDVTLQEQILELIGELRRKLNLAVLLISHDLTLVRRFADRVAVMQTGSVVETNTTAQLFLAPQHPYTRTLLAAEPAGTPPVVAADSPEILNIDRLRVWFPIKQGLFKRTVDHVKAVDEVSLTLRAGETLGIVGESGSGKSTLALAVIRLISSTGGAVVFFGQDLLGLNQKALRPLRRDLQMVFQDPYGSLNPRMSIGQIVGEGLEIQGVPAAAREQAVIAALHEVKLDPETRQRYPHEFSGGQRQRIAIARALVLKPKLLILDEPTSALDRTVQKQIVELLLELQTRHGFGCLFISHDLKVVRALSHRVLVMRNGKMLECQDAEALFANPQHEYTQLLLKAAFASSV